MADPTPTAPRRPNPLELERYLLGELSPERTAEIDALKADDPGLGELLREMRAEDAAARISHPAGRMAAEIEARAGVTPASKKRGSWLAWATPILATAVVMFVALPPDRPAVPPDAGPDTTMQETRPKASAEALQPRLRVYRKAAGEAAPLEDGATVAPGEVVQVAYKAGDQAHGVILSVDGAGAVSLHWPTRPDGPTALDGGGEVRLERAWALDDAPKFERFWFVTSPVPLDVSVVVQAARDLAGSGMAATSLALPLQQKVQQRTLLLRKQEAP